MKLNIRWRLLKDAVTKWLEDEPFQLAAALSYYTLFSLAPLLIIVISIAGFAFGRDAAQDRIVETIQGLVGRESAQAIQTIIQNASSESRSGVISTVFGFLILLIGAGGVVRRIGTIGRVSKIEIGLPTGGRRNADGRRQRAGQSIQCAQ